LEDLNQFAKNVEKAANQKREEDEVLTDAPDEFLDPIMSTVMMDPVILPSSKVTIDRQTIARYITHIMYKYLNVHICCNRKLYKYSIKCIPDIY
jgi:hypothetical protein